MSSVIGIHMCSTLVDNHKKVKLQQLTSLDLVGTKVTKEGVCELQKALPKCKIIHNAKNPTSQHHRDIGRTSGELGLSGFSE
jgi:hypothetical protein